jgi:hypothetical protein
VIEKWSGEWGKRMDEIRLKVKRRESSSSRGRRREREAESDGGLWQRRKRISVRTGGPKQAN